MTHHNQNDCHPTGFSAHSSARFLDKVCRFSGETLDEPIEPSDLLIASHRDKHFMEILARWYLSRKIARSCDEGAARGQIRNMRRFARSAARLIGAVTGWNAAKVSSFLFGLDERAHYFRFKPLAEHRERAQEICAALQNQAAERLAAVADSSGRLHLKVLLTGGTGFVGREIIKQAARDPDIDEMIVLIRQKTIIDKRTGMVTEVISPEQRGQDLMRNLFPDDSREARKFRFLDGDVEQLDLGLSADAVASIRRQVTHVIHCAASVAFDDPYEQSFRANVEGTLNALAFSRRLQDDPESPFIAHIAIETSYLHGRQANRLAREGMTIFPRDFFNNYYELTKAMASLETERQVLAEGLRAVELCPAIVIGNTRTGNNRGDTKVINAPVNLFGQAREALKRGAGGSVFTHAIASLLARAAFVFPGDSTAELNLVPVDWVAAGVLSALKKPRAVGQRIHLATDNRVKVKQLVQIIEEELQVKIHLVSPALFRHFVLPVVSRALKLMHQEKMASCLHKLAAIFSGYSEWGQPLHEVGRDVSILGMPADRPSAADVFRMLCRHNEWVQEFGKVRDPAEIARRERVWEALMGTIERCSGKRTAALSNPEFCRMAGLLDAGAPKQIYDESALAPLDFFPTRMSSLA